MIPQDDFPQLAPGNHRVTSPATTVYNCIAWSAGDTANWWEPGVYWPVPVPPDEFGTGALVLAFEALGYEACADGGMQPGFEKVALYGISTFYTHAARQLPDGKWTSKLGAAEDIEHATPDDVAGGLYGQVVQFMRRPLQGASAFHQPPAPAPGGELVQ